MYVKELEYLRQYLKEGVLLDQDTFQKSMTLLLPEAKEDAISVYVKFAQERVEMNQFVSFIEEPEPVALSRWFDTTLASFVQLTEQFGKETATQVCNLSVDGCAFYPYEMEGAARQVQKGTGVDAIRGMMLDGLLEAPVPVFPKLQEVLQDEPRQEPNSEITF